MSPSLIEKFNQIYPPPDRESDVDLEDMSYANLIFRPGVREGVYDLSGKSALVGLVDPNAGYHTVFIDEYNLELTLSNDADVYE